MCVSCFSKTTVKAIQVETRGFKPVIRCLNARVGINPLPISAIHVECERDVWDNVGGSAVTRKHLLALNSFTYYTACSKPTGRLL